MSAADRLAEIEARANAATEGPWQFLNGESWGGASAVATGGLGHPLAFVGDGRLPEVRADAAFIAAARQDVPALVAALRAVLVIADAWDRAGKDPGWGGMIRDRIEGALGG